MHWIWDVEKRRGTIPLRWAIEGRALWVMDSGVPGLPAEARVLALNGIPAEDCVAAAIDLAQKGQSTVAKPCRGAQRHMLGAGANPFGHAPCRPQLDPNNTCSNIHCRQFHCERRPKRGPRSPLDVLWSIGPFPMAQASVDGTTVESVARRGVWQALDTPKRCEPRGLGSPPSKYPPFPTVDGASTTVGCGEDSFCWNNGTLRWSSTSEATQADNPHAWNPFGATWPKSL